MTGVSTMIYTLILMGALVTPGLGGYNITVVTVPSKGPFRLRTSVTLSCRVNPQPPGTVVYSWKSYDPYSSLPSGNSTSSNTTLSINYNYLHLGWYFCYVYHNGILIGVGRTLVETEGFVYTNYPRAQFFIPGQTVTLRVNISTHSYAMYIAQLTWFHNGTEVAANCTSGRITVNTRGTELNITNTTSSDGGRYTVRVSALDFYGSRNSRQDSLWLPPLEHYTPHAPVTYILMEQGKSAVDLEATSQPNYQYLHLPRQFTIQQYFESSLIPLLNNIQIQWYHNSTAVDGSRTNSSLESQGERLTLSLTAFNTSEGMDLGLYEGVVYVDITHLYSSTGHSFDYFLYVAGYLNIGSFFQVASFQVVLLQYEPPSMSVTAEQPALEGRESTILTCSAHGGRPDTHNLTWTKDGVVLARGRGTTLNYNTLSSFPNPFSRYVCTVESLYSSEEKSVLIQEKASLQIQMALGNTETECGNWTNARTISQAVTTVIQDLCHCNITADSLQDSSLTCSQTGDSTVFTSSLLYSSDNGSTTASMLVDMLQTWLLTSDNTSTTVDESLVEFSRTCPTRLTPQTSGACTRPLSPRVECEQPTVACAADNGGAAAGAFIGGLLIGIAIFGAVIGVGICILRWRADPGRSTSGGQGGGVGTGKEELEMKPNAAYETVHYAEPPVYEPTS